MSREDYDDGEWERIGVRRQGARLDPPSAEATELLRRLGYTDVRHTTTTAHDHNDEDDARNKADDEAGDDDDDDDDEEVEVHTEGWTCWAGTRVDYAWLSNDLQRAVVDARLRVVPDLTVSDHRPLLLSLRVHDPTPSTDQPDCPVAL
jgi:endonuclease/exonuclease/phosphatase family metal-dependent hydrolase